MNRHDENVMIKAAVGIAVPGAWGVDLLQQTFAAGPDGVAVPGWPAAPGEAKWAQ
jgi:hypothetical protein